MQAIICGPKIVQKIFFTEKPFFTGKYIFHIPLRPIQEAKVDSGPTLTLGQANKR